ncbi:MAG: hypothetical protein JWR42_1118, partial [Marmoricola sp.]|nr:hypothetical protein [Marmoricola sp.]
DFAETPSLRRSNAFDVVAAEVHATRAGVGVLDTTAFSRFEVTGTGARAWLDRLLAGVVPEPGRVRLTPMLSASGRLTGDLTTTCWAEDEFWLMGSYYLRAWHLRWFRDRLPTDGTVTLDDLSDRVAGVSLSGPRSLELISRLAPGVADLRWLHATELDLGPHRVRAGRLSVTGELGYELNVPATQLAPLYRLLRAAGDGLDVVPLGYEALDVMRLEKSFGIWSREFTWAYTPGMSGLDRFVAFDKPAFEGRDAALRERDRGAPQRLVTLAVDATDAEAGTFDPLWSGERRVGFVTSGGYGHSVGQSLALGYVDRACAEVGTELEVHVVGRRTSARVIAVCPHDPAGARPRDHRGGS